jgi:hypothetical protein
MDAKSYRWRYRWGVAWEVQGERDGQVVELVWAEDSHQQPEVNYLPCFENND